jgi:hypothetical protein
MNKAKRLTMISNATRDPNVSAEELGILVFFLNRERGFPDRPRRPHKPLRHRQQKSPSDPQ